MEFIVRWNTGYGDSYEMVEAETEEEAVDLAYELWKEESDNNADYDVVGEATEELKEEYGV